MARIKSKNTAVYSVNPMAADGAPGSIAALGDGDPAVLIDPGTPVAVIGPPEKNAHGVAYVPLAVKGKSPGEYWVRASSVDQSGDTPQQVSTALIPVNKPTLYGFAWWQILLGVTGLAAIGTGIAYIAKKRKR